MLGVISSAPQQVFYQPHAQQIIYKNSNTKMLPYIPPEIVRIVLSFLKDDKKSLAACALVNHTFNLHVTPILYRTTSLSLPSTFTLFVNAINGESQCSRLIRHLDLSGFSTFGLQKSDASIQNVVTPDALIKILRFCTMLEAFSVSETLKSSITAEVLKVLVFECRNLKSLDLCGISNKQAFASLANDMGRVEFVQNYDDDDVLTYSFRKPKYALLPHLKRLSLHECHSISESPTVLTLLAHSPNLTHLDLGSCGISDATLNFLATETNAPRTLTHLLLAKCKNISSEAIAALVAVCENLEVLNLYGDRDIATAISEYDLITILTSPSAKKFKTLDIGSSYVTSHVLSSIQENCPSLQHLGIAKSPIRSAASFNDFLKAMPNLQYIDLTGIACLSSINIGFVINSSNSLRVIEMSETLWKKLGPINGWKVNENHTRRRYYAKQINGERPDRIHPRKLDMAESGPERMSKNFQYYSFDV